MNPLQLAQKQYELDAKLYKENWHSKPLLQKIYADFYKLMSDHIVKSDKTTIEIGSGSSQIKDFIPHVITTDVFDAPWLDRKEDIYNLQLEPESIANIVMLDVLHHLRFPGSALEQCHQALMPGGRIVLLEPYVSISSLPIYGLLHHEPVGLFEPITWYREESNESTDSYFASQALPSKLFLRKEHKTAIERQWNILTIKKLAYWRYMASGGFRNIQLYPTAMYDNLSFIDRITQLFPTLFGNRMLVVLEKRE